MIVSKTMTTIKQSKKCSARVFATGVAALMFFGVAQLPKAQEARTNSPPRDSTAAPKGKWGSGQDQPGAQGKATSSQAVEKAAKPRPRQLTGAELYSMHCARCHPERYPNERTSAQWKTIGLHMRVRANLPADHFRKLLKYLQENSGY